MVIYFEKISICTPFSTIVNSPRSSASFSQRRFSLSVKMCGVVMLQFCIASLEIYILQLSPELSLPSSIYLAERVPFSGTLICVSTPPGRMVPLKYSPSAVPSKRTWVTVFSDVETRYIPVIFTFMVIIFMA